MKLLKLEIENAFSFGRAVVNFSEMSAHTQIIGINLDEDNSGTASNGAGKTSIFLCLTECLYGKNIKNVKKDAIPNNNINNGYSITTYFSVGEDTYSVKNTRDTRGKAGLIFYKNSVDISQHTIPNTYISIKKVLGMDYTLFSKLVYQSSTYFLDFLTITDSERKKLLVGLFNLDKYSDKILRAKDRLNEYAKDLREVQVVKNKLLSEIKIKVESKKRLLENLDDSTYKIDIARLSDLQSEKANIEVTNLNIDKHAALLQYCKDFVEPELVEEPNMLRVLELETEISSIRHAIQYIRRELIDYENKPDTCSLCGQSIDNSFSKTRADNLKDRLVSTESQQAGLVTEFDALILDKKSYNNYTSIMSEHMQKIARLDAGIAVKTKHTVEDLNKEIAETREAITLYERRVKEIQCVNEDTIAFNSKQDTLQTLKDKATNKLGIVEKEYEEILEKHNAYKQLHLALQKLLVYVMENMVISLQQSVNSYINYLFSSDLALSITMVKDKLVFSIAREGKIVDLCSLSSGEMSRVQVSVLLAIRDVLTSMSGTDIDVLILDEILSSLDEPGRVGLYALLDTVAYKVLSISHSYTDNKLDNLVIEKKNGVAQICQ